jgi:hypothetical protein
MNYLVSAVLSQVPPADERLPVDDEPPVVVWLLFSPSPFYLIFLFPSVLSSPPSPPSFSFISNFLY